MYALHSPMLSRPNVPLTSHTAGAKGRAAFVQAPTVAKEQRKAVDYSAFPLTLQGELVSALLESRISAYPHQAVAMQVFESFARYNDFFKVRKNCIVPALEAMVDARYVCMLFSY